MPPTVDIECTVQPCPWLEPERAAGQALFFKELKEAWPTVLLSLYVSGAPDVRITAARALPSAGRAYPFGYSAEQVRPMAPHLDQVRSVTSVVQPAHFVFHSASGGFQRASCGQVVYGGYAPLNYSYLSYNTEVNCHVDPHAPIGSDTCGGVNANQTVRYALVGTGGSGKCQTAPGPQPTHPCAAPSWSTVSQAPNDLTACVPAPPNKSVDRKGDRIKRNI